MTGNSLDIVKINVSPGEKYDDSARKFQGISGIEVSKSGRIWTIWYGGGITEGSENYVILASSSDNGNTCSKPFSVIDPPGNVRAYDPVFWHDPQSRLWWFWSQSLSPKDGKIHDGRAGVWCVFTDDSDNPEPVFSKPRRIANGVMMNKPTVLSIGEWRLHVAVWEYYDPKLEELKNERFSNLIEKRSDGKITKDI